MHKQSHQNTHPTFTYRKGRIFYFRRKIPSDLRCHYKRPVFVQSLRTTSRSSAQKAATILSARLDEQWLMLRIKHNQSPASQLLVEAEHKSVLPLISEILERYLDRKGHGKAKLFIVHARHNKGYAMRKVYRHIFHICLTWPLTLKQTFGKLGAWGRSCSTSRPPARVQAYGSRGLYRCTKR